MQEHLDTAGMGIRLYIAKFLLNTMYFACILSYGFWIYVPIGYMTVMMLLMTRHGTLMCQLNQSTLPLTGPEM